MLRWALILALLVAFASAVEWEFEKGSSHDNTVKVDPTHRHRNNDQSKDVLEVNSAILNLTRVTGLTGAARVAGAINGGGGGGGGGGDGGGSAAIRRAVSYTTAAFTARAQLIQNGLTQLVTITTDKAVALERAFHQQHLAELKTYTQHVINKLYWLAGKILCTPANMLALRKFGDEADALKEKINAAQATTETMPSQKLTSDITDKYNQMITTPVITATASRPYNWTATATASQLTASRHHAPAATATPDDGQQQAGSSSTAPADGGQQQAGSSQSTSPATATAITSSTGSTMDDPTVIASSTGSTMDDTTVRLMIRFSCGFFIMNISANVLSNA
jgi:hypothetical protein